MYSKCPKCGRTLRDTGTDGYCPDCGEPIKSRIRAIYSNVDEEESPFAVAMAEGPRALFERLVSFGCLIGIIMFLITMALCVVALAVGIPEVLANAKDAVGVIFLVTPTPAGHLEFEGPAFIAYYLFLVSAILASFGYAIWSERKELGLLLKESLVAIEAPGRDNRNTMLMVAQVYMAILFIDIVYVLILLAAGVSQASPDFASMTRWELLYMFARASVWEEIAVRVAFIGGGYFLYKALTSRSSRDDRLWTARGIGRMLLGGNNVFDIPTVGLIVFSAMMFGFAHVGGWDLWKAIPTAISGLGFGYLFVRKGVHAAIMLHFAFDYLSLGFGLLPANTTVAGVMVMFMFVWAAAGLVYVVFYGRKALRWFVRKEPEIRETERTKIEKEDGRGRKAPAT